MRAWLRGVSEADNQEAVLSIGKKRKLSERTIERRPTFDRLPVGTNTDSRDRHVDTRLNVLHCAALFQSVGPLSGNVVRRL